MATSRTSEPVDVSVDEAVGPPDVTPPPAHTGPRRLRDLFGIAGRHTGLIIMTGLIALPFLWMVTNSIKTTDEMWASPPVWWPAEAVWSNFPDAWSAARFGRYMFNSFVVAGAIVAIQTVNTAMLAYAITQMRFWGRDMLFGLVLVTYMLPVPATYVVSFIILSRLGWLDSYQGLIVSNSVSVLAIFLVRQAFLQVPRDYIEAARMDGASHWKVLWQICFPLAKPVFITVGILNFIIQYNNYFWPRLITRSDEMRLVSVGLRQFFIEAGAYGIQWPLIMAAATFIVVPLLLVFLFVQKWLVRAVSLTSGQK
jgi:multiple sugar transport system permease protein